MGKRFFTTDLWSRNRWFRELSPDGKLFWLYLLGVCDNVGVWEEDWDMASFIIGKPLDREKILQEIDGRLVRINDAEMIIPDFCDFQYKNLRDGSNDQAGKSYIKLLQYHGLWDSYRSSLAGAWQPLGSPLAAPKDKDKDIDKDKDMAKAIDKTTYKRRIDNEEEPDDFFIPEELDEEVDVFLEEEENNQ